MNGPLQVLEQLAAWLQALLARLTPLLAPLFGPGDLDLGWPAALLALPLPVLTWWLLPAHRERLELVRVPFFEEMAAATGLAPRRGSAVLRRTFLQWVLAPLAWTLIVLALARPEWVEPPLRKTETARDLLLAVDLSQSMEARDFEAPDGRRLDRLEAVKLVLGDFIERREGDRLALVVFGDAAYLQAPFTRDLDVCRMLLDETRIGMAGPHTVIGDAIGLGIRLFEASDAKDKVIILLTDGNDTGSRVPPAKAARLAAERGVRVHTVGIGDPASSGEARVDFTSLRTIAATTGGRSYLAGDRERLAGIYAELDRIEPRELQTASYRPRRPLCHWPLGAATVLLFAFYALMTVRLLLRSVVRREGTVHA
jgi:Ca-activated chloride channel family protein